MGAGGAGGRDGVVSRAYDLRLQREVALMEMRSDPLDPDGERRRMEAMRLRSKLTHPNLVAVYDLHDLQALPGHSRHPRPTS